MKKIKALMSMMVLLSYTFVAKAGFEVDGVFYDITSDSTVAVTYKQDKYGNPDSENEYSGSIIIPETITYNNKVYTVTCIGYGAFYYNARYMTSISIPRTITRIGEIAFDGCDNLRSVYLEDLEAWCKVDFMYDVYTYGPSSPFNRSGARLYLNGEEVKDLVIPNSVTRIGRAVFDGCKSITSVTIPNSVTEIGQLAFSGCNNIAAVHITDLSAWCNINFEGFIHIMGLEPLHTSNPLSYGGRLYLNGKEITEVEIPNSVSKLYATFNGCVSLTHVTIPNSVTSIANSAFYRCSNLKNVAFSDSVMSIGDYAFSGCSSLTSVIMPNSMTSIGENVFRDCSNLKNVTFSESMTSTGYSTFWGCSALTSVTLPKSLTCIYYDTFVNCSSLENITIPNSVTSIKDWAFHHCENLKTVINFSNLELVKGDESNGYVAYYADKVINADMQIGDFFFDRVGDDYYLTGHLGEGKELELPEDCDGENYSIGKGVFKNYTSLTNVTIPKTVKGIGQEAFAYCGSLDHIIIPNSVKSIGSQAFYGCRGLKTVINFSDLEVTKGSSSNGYVAYYANKVVNADLQIGDFFFIQNQSKFYLSGYVGDETELILPESCNGSSYEVLNGAFRECSNITSVTIPNSVTNIGDEAFEGCSALTRVVLPNSLGNISNRVFSRCYKLTSIVIPNSVKSIGNAAFEGCTGLANVSIPNSVTCIGSDAFSGCSALTNIVLPSSVESINNNLFLGCTSLTDIDIPNSVKSIGDAAFSGCIRLANVSIPNSVVGIGDKAFSRCSGLTHVAIPKSVKSIGGQAFEKCTGIKGVHLEDGESLLSLGSNGRNSGLFSDCPLKTLYLGRNLQYEAYNGDYLSPFYGNESLTTVGIGDSVVSIGKYTFAGCSKLSEITIPNSVKQIGEKALYGTMWWNEQPMGYVYIDNCLLGFKYNGTVPDNLEWSLRIDDGTRIIADNAFEDFDIITNVFIPNSLTHIGNKAFCYCNKLTNVLMGDSVEYVGESAFYGCYNLTSVRVSDVGSWCKILFETPEANPLYYAGHLYLDTEEIIKLNIPNTVKSIGDNAFVNCSNVTEVSVGCNVEYIGQEAFAGCSGVTQFISNAVVPPVCGALALNGIDKWNSTLRVVKGTKSAYQAADQWKEFFFIEDDIVTRIENMVHDKKNSTVLIYRLNGIKQGDTQNLPNGIYIKDGKKVFAQ